MAAGRKTPEQTLKPGFWVAMTVREGASPYRTVVGEVRAVDAHGVRISLIDWDTGEATSWDFYAPWEQITSALVATSEHDMSNFDEIAAQWVREMEAIDAKQPVRRKV